MAGSNIDRQLEAAVGEILKMIGTLILAIFKAILAGVKKLNRWQAWIGVAVGLLIALGAFIFRGKLWQLWGGMPEYMRWFCYTMLLCAPVLYLMILGGAGDFGKGTQDYEKALKDIGFIGKDGKSPVLKVKKAEDKKVKLTFYSNIPLTDWRASKSRLETALDCNILEMEYGRSKRLVNLTTLPSDYVLPKNIDWSDTYCSSKNGVITVGQGALGNISFDLNSVPHVLVAGETGSGKSVILRCILWQMILQGCRVFMIDFKGGVEFGKEYEQYGEVIIERERALEVLDMLVQENEYRLHLLRDMQVKNLAEYNRKTHQNLCRIGVFSDEIAQMLDRTGVSKGEREIFEALEGKLSTLARLSRATGINLVLGVQRPDAKVLTGQIKNNVPVRISGRFADKAASEIVLGNTDAVELPEIKGRFLFKVGNQTTEFQAFLFEDERMLHEVHTEVGEMLRAPRSSPKAEKKDSKKQTPKKEKENVVRMMEFEDDPGEDEELPFGEPDDMDFDFSRDWGG